MFDKKSWQRNYMRNRYNNDPEFRKQILKTVSKSNRKTHHQKRLELLQLVGDTKCAKCGFTDWKALQLDHKNGNGLDDKKRIGFGKKYMQYYLNHPQEAKEKLQVLCANCNWIKRYDNNETSLKHNPYKPL